MAKSRIPRPKQSARFARFMEMARKPVTKRKSRRARHYGRTKRGMGVAPLHNPPLLSDILGYALPGFGGFVATKFIVNAASAQIAKRWPQYAKHAGALSSVGTFLGGWYFANRLKFLAQYHTPLVVGSAIAAAQNLIQIYFPDRFSWIVGSPKQAAIGAMQQQAQLAARVAQQQQDSAPPGLPDHLEEINDDPSWYTFNDAYDAGRYNGTPAANAAVMPATTGLKDTPIEDDDTLATGLFANNGMTASLEN